MNGGSLKLRIVVPLGSGFTAPATSETSAAVCEPLLKLPGVDPNLPSKADVWDHPCTAEFVSTLPTYLEDMGQFVDREKLGAHQDSVS